MSVILEEPAVPVPQLLLSESTVIGIIAPKLNPITDQLIQKNEFVLMKAFGLSI
jgi:hypothetical protein